MMNNFSYGSYASFPTIKNRILEQPFFSFVIFGAVEGREILSNHSVKIFKFGKFVLAKTSKR